MTPKARPSAAMIAEPDVPGLMASFVASFSDNALPKELSFTVQLVHSREIPIAERRPEGICS